MYRTVQKLLQALLRSSDNWFASNAIYKRISYNVGLLKNIIIRIHAHGKATCTDHFTPLYAPVEAMLCQDMLHI